MKPSGLDFAHVLIANEILFKVQIVKASNEMPPVLANFLYPVISMSTNKDEPSHVYLLEEGLELWLVVIENSTTLSPELLELSTNILSIIGMSLA